MDEEQRNSTCTLGGIQSIQKTTTEYKIEYETGESAKLNILNSHTFRYYMSPTGEFPEYPEPDNPTDIAKINIKKVTDYDIAAFEKSELNEKDESYVINTTKIEIIFDKTTGTMKVLDNRTNREVLNEVKSLSYTDGETKQILKQHEDEYFFGGGMQNGRFSHKGEVIQILNTNSWVCGGVSSPCPFYWSTYGYGIMRNTWHPGSYDFGTKSSDIVSTTHTDTYFDAFFFISPQPEQILKDYYELTGQPIFIPEYAFYEAHLNAFNRDYWVKVTPDTPGAILFEDGVYYKSYKPDEMNGKEGILESLNGEKNNYQFSARAMIDRYKRHDVPLGWFVPNDGYGSGYGQTDSLDGDIENLKEFADYARANGVEVALWTESNLHPADPLHPKKGERDLHKEVNIAGVVALKCDVAWIGAGYSFGLNAVEDATNIFLKATKNNVRPMIMMVDGWAGTQRYSTIWSGDQTGGQWEYIRFHIPTYIGASLSGLPIVGSDMDGIYGGGNKEVNIRDYQWKTFTPLQLNMDGWGSTPKMPFSFDKESTDINRAYLKLKSMFLPYNYTIGRESTNGLPMIRAMFLEFPESTLAYTKETQYQYMWGPSILVAPVYNDEKMEGDSLRNGIYLPNPKQVWIDFFTGAKYRGGKILNNVAAPLWKIPIFIKDGAVLPMVNPNNNPSEIKRDVRIVQIYPNGFTSFDVYEDDGITSDHSQGQFASTNIGVRGPVSNDQGDLFVTVHKTEGSYKDMVNERATILRIMASDADIIKAAINEKSIQLSEVKTDDEFDYGENVYYFKEDFIVNPYLTKQGGEEVKQKFLLIKIEKIDVTKTEIQVKVKNYANKGKIFGENATPNANIDTPTNFVNVEEKCTSDSLTLKWESVEDAIYYEIEKDGVIHTNILGTEFSFDGLKFSTEHKLRIRSANDDGISKWSDVLVAVTAEDPLKFAIKDIKVVCNFPCESGQEECNLTDGDFSTIWHTDWSELGQADPDNGNNIKLNFDLQEVHAVENFEYFPRMDAGNGTIMKIKYKYSIDGHNWSPTSDGIEWEPSHTPKTIHFNGTKFRYIEFELLETIENFGSGTNVYFFEKK